MCSFSVTLTDGARSYILWPPFGPGRVEVFIAYSAPFGSVTSCFLTRVREVSVRVGVLLFSCPFQRRAL